MLWHKVITSFFMFSNSKRMKTFPTFGLFICCFLTGARLSTEISGLLRVCYYTDFTPAPSQLNSTLCTHIIAGFSSVKDGLIDAGDERTKTVYREVTALKRSNPHLKVLLSAGGGGNDNGFSEAFDSLYNRTRFIASALTVLNDFDFDGLDIDWEFPVWSDKKTEEKENFLHFLKEFKFGAALYASAMGKSLLLTVAVAAPRNIIDESYNVSEMAKYVDFINLMSYDFHDYFWYTPFTGHNSPLFNRSVEQGYFSCLNTAWSAHYWNQLGMPKSQIMVGIPTYAHTYKLLDPDINGVDAPARDVGIGDGDITFTEVCEFLSSGGVRVFDEQSRVPYAYKDFDWISYEDELSIRGKLFCFFGNLIPVVWISPFYHYIMCNTYGCQVPKYFVCEFVSSEIKKDVILLCLVSLPHLIIQYLAHWIKENGFGGAMTYNLNSDDWSCVCNATPFPLHTVLYRAFLGLEDETA